MRKAFGSGKCIWPGEPAPRSSYEITYRHRTKVAPTNITDGEIFVKAKLKGTLTQSPAIYQGVQTVLGTMDENGDWILISTICSAIRNEKLVSSVSCLAEITESHFE